MSTADAMMDAVQNKRTTAQSFGAGLASARGWLGNVARKLRLDKAAEVLGRFASKIWSATAGVRTFAQANAAPLAVVAVLTAGGQSVIVGAFNLLRRGLNRIDMGIVWAMCKFGTPGRKLALRYATLAARIDAGYDRYVTGSVRKVFSFINGGGYYGMAARYAAVAISFGVMAAAATGALAFVLGAMAVCYGIGVLLAITLASSSSLSARYEANQATYRSEREAAKAKRDAEKAAAKVKRDAEKAVAAEAKVKIEAEKVVYIKSKTEN